MRRIHRYLHDQSGSLSIEFVMWLPLFAFLLVLAGDATMAFMNQSRMWQVSRETARIVSRYGMDELTAESYAQAQLTMGETAPVVDVSFASAKVTVQMTMPVTAMAPFGLLEFAMDDDISVSVTHAMEPI